MEAYHLDLLQIIIFCTPAVVKGIVYDQFKEISIQRFPKFLQQPTKTEVRSRFTLRLMIGYFKGSTNSRNGPDRTGPNSHTILRNGPDNEC